MLVDIISPLSVPGFVACIRHFVIGTGLSPGFFRLLYGLRDLIWPGISNGCLCDHLVMVYVLDYVQSRCGGYGDGHVKLFLWGD